MLAEDTYKACLQHQKGTATLQEHRLLTPSLCKYLLPPAQKLLGCPWHTNGKKIQIFPYSNMQPAVLLLPSYNNKLCLLRPQGISSPTSHPDLRKK